MFVLAHISDVHLAPLPQPRLHELLGKRATGYFNWKRRRHLVHRSDVLVRIVADLKAQAPDHIAVTGDLVNIALAGEFSSAKAWLATLGSPQDVTLVPGNHDTYVRAAAGWPRQHWDAFMRGDEQQDERHDAALERGSAASHPPHVERSDTVGRVGERTRAGVGGEPAASPSPNTSFPFLRRRGPLALIGLSSAVPTAPFMATGKLGAEQLRRAGALLDRAREKGLFRVVLIHHPPLSKPSRRFKRLLDGEDFRAMLARHGAELLLHGHDHENALVWLAETQGRIPAVGVPSASEAPPGKHDAAGYNLYRVDGSSGRWRCEMISRGLTADGERIAEHTRTMLTDG